MTTEETILIAVALQLVTLACCFMAIREAWKDAAESFRKWQVAAQAHADEKVAHAKTREAHRNEILCSRHWLQQLNDEREAHESIKLDLLAERREHGTEARNVDVRTI